MRSSLALFLLAFLLALPILAAPATGPKRIGLRNASSTKTTNAKVRRQQARPDDIKKAAAARALQAPTKLQPRAPQVSKRMGQRLRRAAAPTLDKKDYSSFLCPGGAVACPVVDDDMTSAAITLLGASLNSVADWFRVGFECVELDTELDQCGGCTALGKGQDCSKIENARATGCEKGSCVVFSCNSGFVPNAGRDACIRKENAAAAADADAADN